MNNKFYAVQRDRADAWDNGSDDLDTAKDMLKRQGAGLIAVIENGFCVEEINFFDLFSMYDLTNDELAGIVERADAWDKPGVWDAMEELCDRAGRKLRDMTGGGVDCSAYFGALRAAAAEFLADTPDVSNDTPDLIDWLSHGAEQADAVRLAYAIQDILDVDLGI